VWHFLLIHDDYGNRVGEIIGVTADDVRKLQPLASQVLTDEDKRRLQTLGKNGDSIDASVWGQWTSSVKNHQASADDVLGGMPNSSAGRQAAE
jgi:catalase